MGSCCRWAIAVGKEPKWKLSKNLATGESFKAYFVFISYSFAEKTKSYLIKTQRYEEISPNIKTKIIILTLLNLRTGNFGLGIPV